MAFGIGTGAVAVIGAALGRGNLDELRRRTTQAIPLAVTGGRVFAVAGRQTIGPLFHAIGADALLLATGLPLWARLFSDGPEVRTGVARDASLVSSRLAAVGYGLGGGVFLQGLRRRRSALAMIVSRVALLVVPGVWIGGLVSDAVGTFAGLGIAQSIGGGLGALRIRRELDRSGATAIR